jgi:hypothetical protein
MKARNLSIILFLTLFVISGCEKVVEFNEKDIKPQLVVNCLLNPNNILKVKVTKSKSTTDETLAFEVVKGAMVTFSDGANTFSDFVFVEDQDTFIYYNWSKYNEEDYFIFENGYYTSPSIKISSNQNYSITVSAPDFESVTSNIDVPSIVPIEEIDTFITQLPQQYTLNARINFTDPIQEKNFYLLEMEKVSLYLSEDSNNQWNQPNYFYTKAIISPDDPVFEKENTGIFSVGGSAYPIFKDNLIDGKNYSISFGIESVYTNVEFTGFPFNNSWGDLKNYQLDVYKINFYSISESYYQYFKTKSMQHFADGDPFSDPVMVYTNIENGMGIFGSSSISSKYIMTSNFPDSLLTKLLPSRDSESVFNFIKEEDAKPSKGDYSNY